MSPRADGASDPIGTPKPTASPNESAAEVGSKVNKLETSSQQTGLLVESQLLYSWIKIVMTSRDAF